MSDQTNTSFQDFDKPETLVEDFPHLFGVNQIKALMRERNKNGLTESGAVISVSNKFYLHREKFLNWFAGQRA